MKTEFKEKEDNTSQIERKICTKCCEVKPATAEYYSRQKNGRGGLRGECKECQAEYNAMWAKTNSERLKKTRKIWKNENREKIRSREQIDCRLLSDSYIKIRVRRQFSIPASEITQDIIDAKRRDMKYNRELKQLKKQLK